ncbi:DUF4129 domain-containing protein [Pontibacillus marinus]|uniref:Protein-glutamine gamma-glutamyltransferase-like C-terminal domain-containing protein n=1 Tax=Pontibacillus marinus BH030004 = DSM 16465 TaxID=1385511 RepID=A0A0A5GBU5_9BACI|nr:DUF4129 domain-containing protein [Pontibacillus marinus]KGX90656.1 hypothetical protein N783_20060 [Pontibacillus marinus BH030004 = DSM 16465]
MSKAQQAKEKLDQILEQDEYQVYYEEQENPFQYLLNQIGEWLLRMFQKLFPQIQITDQAVDVTMYVLGAVGIVILILLVVLIKRNLASNRTSRSNAHPIQHKDELAWSSDKHLQEASSYKQKGDYQQAIRHVFLAMLLYFDQQKWIEARVWKTNWDYYEELKKINLVWATQFYELAQRFDEVTYGEREVDEQEYESYRQQALEWLNSNRESS